MIKAENLSMYYGPVLAMDKVSFDVKQGEIVGMLGPNGAGKSTTMKILTTYLYPSSGTAMVGGKNILTEPLAVRKLIGYLPEVLPLYMDMEVRDYLRFVGRARGVTGKELKDRIEWVIDNCGLRPMFRKVIRELSKGYKQRTALAQALLHDPEVIILDEPTSGLDPHQIVEIRHLIRNLAEGRTVIVSTHILQEVEAVSDRIIIINRGRIVGDGTVAQLREKTKDAERVVIGVAAPRDEVKKTLGGLSEAKDIRFMREERGAVVFELQADPGKPILPAVGDLAKENNWKLTELKEKPFSLEQIFLSLTKPEIESKGGAA